MQPIQLRKGGTEAVYRCPQCGHPKLHINRKRGVWFCFREGTGGLIESSPLVRSLLQAIASPAMDSDPTTPREAGERTLGQTPEIALTRLHLVDGLVSQLSKDYLLERGLTLPQIHRYAYIPEDDRFIGRVALRSPVTEAWTARAYLPGMKPPYLNPSGIKRPWLTSRSSRYVVVEGVFDAMALERGGWVSAALLGSSLSGKNLEFFRDTETLVLLDRRTSEKAWTVWSSLSLVSHSRLVFFDEVFPAYKDAGEIPANKLHPLEGLWKSTAE